MAVGIVSEPLFEQLDRLYIIMQRTKKSRVKKKLFNRIIKLEEKLYRAYGI